jgi:membrane protein DedA with SNARE-associated domain
MYASFLAHKSHELNLLLVILVAASAAIVGDNLGFLAGRRLGPRLLNWLKRKFDMELDIATASDLIKRHGAATVFWGRYIFGLRTIMGPVAGALNMDWKRFLLFNALGAISWVSSMSILAYAIAGGMQSLAGFIEKISWGISGAVFLIGYILWRRNKKRMRQTGHAL